MIVGLVRPAPSLRRGMTLLSRWPQLTLGPALMQSAFQLLHCGVVRELLGPHIACRMPEADAQLL